MYVMGAKSTFLGKNEFYQSAGKKFFLCTSTESVLLLWLKDSNTKRENVTKKSKNTERYPLQLENSTQ